MNRKKYMTSSHTYKNGNHDSSGNAFRDMDRLCSDHDGFVVTTMVTLWLRL